MKRYKKNHIIDPTRLGITLCGRWDMMGRAFVITQAEFLDAMVFYTHPEDCKTCFRIINAEAANRV